MLLKFFSLFKQNKPKDKKLKYEKVILLVLDGFGVNPKIIDSPWKLAKHPNFEEIEKFYPFTALQASGMAVGLPFKEEGNSEVGHLTMGAGRIVYTALPRILNAIQDGSFFTNESFLKAADFAKSQNRPMHFVGLFSSGSVHANAGHLYALLEFAKKNNLPEVFLHLFTDGRDAAKKEGFSFISDLEKKLEEKYNNVKITSIIGRDFAMDRDGHWDKIEKTYRLLTEGVGEKFKNASEFIKECYEKNITDEFIPPAVFRDNGGSFPGVIKKGDSVVFFNFREDSMREISSAFLKNKFSYFKTIDMSGSFFVTMTEYEKNGAFAAFLPLTVENPLAKVISDSGKNQIHIAETEKYAHVTYFFNGGKEENLTGEERLLVPSKQDSNFEEVPEMSAKKIEEIVLQNMQKYNFMLVNFANADMVGHTGNFSATIKAMEVLDLCVGNIMAESLNIGAALLITGDHGNAEEKFYEQSGEKKTKHSINPVPFYLILKEFKYNNPISAEEILKKYQKIQGSLTDIAPTVLELMDIKKPLEMTGISLIKELLNNSN